VIAKHTDISDGLHLTSQGYEALFGEFQRLVETEFKGLNPEQMDMNMPQYVLG
jgi:hypothetical protein